MKLLAWQIMQNWSIERMMKASIRKDVLERDKQKCRKCRRESNLQINHIVPRSNGGSDDLFNLATLCEACHHEWHAYELSTGNCSQGGFAKWLTYPTLLQIITAFFHLSDQELTIKKAINMLDVISNKRELENRTNKGLMTARFKGIKGGRQKALDKGKVQRLHRLYDETNADGSSKYAIKEICEMMDISRSSLYRYIKEA